LSSGSYRKDLLVRLFDAVFSMAPKKKAFLKRAS
jgi:hypothetical protein